MRTKANLVILGICLAIFTAACYCHAADFSIFLVADKNTPIPGGTGNFTLFPIAPDISNRNVAFLGVGHGGQLGIYMDIGGALTKIADLNTPIPGGTGNFTGFTGPLISNSNVAFEGTGDGGQNGIYTNIGGVLTNLADRNTPIPGGTGNFEKFDPPVISGANVAFFCTGDGGQQGIYTNIGGVLTNLADVNTPIPGGTGNFGGFSDPAISNGDVSFEGGGIGQLGIYASIGGVLTKVADLNTPIPGGTGNFTNFIVNIPPQISNGNVAFLALGNGGQRGDYTNIGGALTKIADLNTPIPGGTGNFTDVFEPQISNGNVAFLALGNGGQQGIYKYIGGALTKVVDVNTPIPGGTGNFTALIGPALSNGNVAFLGSGNGGQQGAYMDIGGALTKIADLNTPIPDGTGDFTGFHFITINNGNVVFENSDQDGIYFASPLSTVPALGTFGMVFFIIVLVASACVVFRKRHTTMET